MEITKTSLPQKKKRSLFVRQLFNISNESIIFDQNVGKLYKVDAITRQVWNLCNGRRNVQEMIEIITSNGDQSNNISEENLFKSIRALIDLDWIKMKTEKHNG